MVSPGMTVRMTLSNNTHARDRGDSVAAADDEISLVDLARLLVRRRFWILGVFALGLFLTVAYALLLEERFAYTTHIELGAIGPDEMLVSSRASLNEVQEALLPGAKRDFLAQQKLQTMPFSVVVNGNDDSRFLTLETQVPPHQHQRVAVFHRLVFERLQHSHDARLSIVRQQSEARLQALRETLTDTQQQLQTLVNISNEVSHEASQNNRSGELALLLKLNQFQLSDRVMVTESGIQQLRRELMAEKARQDWMRPTRAEAFAIASLSPVGTSRSLVVALGGVLSAMLGLFVGVMAEFAVKVRESTGEPMASGIEKKFA